MVIEKTKEYQHPKRSHRASRTIWDNFRKWT